MTQRVGIPTASQVAGDVFASFQRLNNIISKNDGIRSFSVITNNCYDSDQGFDDSQQTHIRITTSLHDINQLSETYLRITFRAKCHFNKEIIGDTKQAQHVASTDVASPMCFFLGWKNANECLKQLEVENMNINTNYLQTECAKEGFCYSTYKPKEEKKSRKFVHSRYEDVQHMSEGVCGAYFGCLNDGSNSFNMEGAQITAATDAASPGGDSKIGTRSFTVDNINVILPITDILAFQCFEDFPGGLGDIVLKIFFNKDSMVWTVVDPYTCLPDFVSRHTNLCKTSGVKQQFFDHNFYQVGTTVKFFKQFALAGPTGGYGQDDTNQLTIDELYCKDFRCECYGYNVTQECKRQLVSLFTPSSPYIIPAQQIDIKYFSNRVSDNGHYDSDFTYALHNVTDFVIVFPEASTCMTCFRNPLAKNIQLRVDGKLYPNQAFENTWDHRFYMAMMNASDFNSFYEADDEYVDSIIKVNSGKSANWKTLTDVSSFIMTMQAERNSGGFFFDGLETGNQNVNIALRFDNPLAGEPPQVWFTRDTYWTVDNENGLRYWKQGTPASYASADDATVQ